mmetsp:Transcript_33312/g.95405  ORF Transcript_33312/g.95405 Transcript_33312/m.95405 type:complete len:253 (-) Transcript_33312:39-797(-)
MPPRWSPVTKYICEPRSMGSTALSFRTSPPAPGGSVKAQLKLATATSCFFCIPGFSLLGLLFVSLASASDSAFFWGLATTFRLCTRTVPLSSAVRTKWLSWLGESASCVTAAPGPWPRSRRSISALPSRPWMDSRDSVSTVTTSAAGPAFCDADERFSGMNWWKRTTAWGASARTCWKCRERFVDTGRCLASKEISVISGLPFSRCCRCAEGSSMRLPLRMPVLRSSSACSVRCLPRISSRMASRRSVSDAT